MCYLGMVTLAMAHYIVDLPKAPLMSMVIVVVPAISMTFASRYENTIDLRRDVHEIDKLP
jgi:hypothetical protein